MSLGWNNLFERVCSELETALTGLVFFAPDFFVGLDLVFCNQDVLIREKAIIVLGNEIGQMVLLDIICLLLV